MKLLQTPRSKKKKNQIKESANKVSANNNKKTLFLLLELMKVSWTSLEKRRKKAKIRLNIIIARKEATIQTNVPSFQKTSFSFSHFCLSN